MVGQLGESEFRERIDAIASGLRARETTVQIGRRLGLSKSTISRSVAIAKQQGLWPKDLAGDRRKSATKAKLTEAELASTRQDMIDGLSNEQIRAKYGLPDVSRAAYRVRRARIGHPELPSVSERLEAVWAQPENKQKLRDAMTGVGKRESVKDARSINATDQHRRRREGSSAS